MSKHKKDVLNPELLINFFNIRLNRLLVFVSIILLFGIYLYFSNFHQENIFPGNKNSQFTFYTDTSNGGNSIILYRNISNSTIAVDFKLNDGFMSPYVGINMRSKKDTIFNLSSYNRLNLEISGVQLRSVGFSLFAPNVYGTNKREVCFNENIDIDSSRKKYVVDLNKLKIPEWWYGVNNVPVDERIEPDLKHVYRISIGSAYAAASDIKRSIRVYSISFDRENIKLIPYLILAEFIFILLLLFVHYLKTYKALPVTITYKAIDTENESRQLNSFLYYINNNFNDPGLTLQQVSDQTGVNQRRITTSIQQTYACNFKTYVNRLRINESKRLLLETELNMGEIAAKVGFSNQTHFNRVFKSFEGINPSEFLRKK